MGYSLRRLLASISLTGVSVIALVVFVLASQIAFAILPVIGIGGFFLQAGTFEGQNGLVYPVKGQLSSDYPDEVTDTARCQERPMLAFRLDNADVSSGYAIFKDVKLPWFDDRWMTIRLDERPGGAIEGNRITLYTTQLEADTLRLDNIALSESNNGQIWGPRSGELTLRGDPQDSITGNDLRATGVKAWVHALSAESINFQPGGGSISLNVTFSTTSQLQDRYDSAGILNDIDNEQRENYFDCLPGQPALRDSPLLSEDFDGGTVPAGWTTQNLQVTTNTANSTPYSVQLNGSESVLQTPSFDLSTDVGLAVSYWIREGDDSFSEDPDPGEYIVVEYRSSRGEWIRLDTKVGGAFGGPQGRIFEGGVTLPQGAYHDDFALRFRTEGGLAGGSTPDNWHVDDVKIG